MEMPLPGQDAYRHQPVLQQLGPLHRRELCASKRSLPCYVALAQAKPVAMSVLIQAVSSAFAQRLRERIAVIGKQPVHRAEVV